MRIEKDEIVKGEVWTYNYSFVAIAARLGTSLLSADWSVEGNVISIQSESISSNVASVEVTPSNAGCAMLKITATMADGTIVVRHIQIKVVDPMCYSIPGYSRYA